MPKIIQVPTHSDDRGKLSVVEKILPFQIKRVFYIYNSFGSKRGGHRHYKTIQALICVNGKCDVYTNNGENEETYTLNSPEMCLIVYPEDWHTMNSFSEDSVLIVLASEFYDAEDYIIEGY